MRTLSRSAERTSSREPYVFIRGSRITNRACSKITSESRRSRRGREPVRLRTSNKIARRCDRPGPTLYKVNDATPLDASRRHVRCSHRFTLLSYFPFCCRGFSVSVCGSQHIFKPVSVQAMWWVEFCRCSTQILRPAISPACSYSCC